MLIFQLKYFLNPIHQMAAQRAIAAQCLQLEQPAENLWARGEGMKVNCLS